MAAAMSDAAAAPVEAAAERSPLSHVSVTTRGPFVLKAAALVVLYYGSAKLGYEFNFAGPVAAIIWLPVGVAIAFLSVFGLAFWPAVLIGDLLANDYTALPLGAALGQTTGNVLEVLVAAALLRRLMRRGSPLASIGGVTEMLVAIAAGTMISAIVGPISLTIAGVFTVGSLPEIIRTWWLGDLCGALVVVPLALAWHPLPRHLPPPRLLVEGILLITLVASLSAIGAVSHDPLLYLVFPALMWSAVRLGARGATLAVAVAVGITIWATTHHEGAFVFHSISHSVISAQLFIAVAALSTLFLTALVSEREAFAVRLGESRAQVYRAAETERMRIERNLHDGAQQRLLALGVRLRLATARAESADPWIPTAFADADGELSAALDDLRDLSHGTHPSVLTELGLADALKSVAARSAIPVVSLDLPATEVDLAAEEAAFYFVVEAVANAQKHSAAESIRIAVAFANGTLRLEVVDDGVGGADERAGSGLRGLRERVEALDGTFRCESPPGHGTTIAAAIPASAA